MTGIFKLDYRPKEGFFICIRLPQRLVWWLLRIYVGRKKSRQKERIELKVD